jgi:hypothetical protein
MKEEEVNDSRKEKKRRKGKRGEWWRRSLIYITSFLTT